MGGGGGWGEAWGGLRMNVISNVFMSCVSSCEEDDVKHIFRGEGETIPCQIGCVVL